MLAPRSIDLITLILVCLFIQNQTIGQQHTIDSLSNRLAMAKDDSSRISILIKLAETTITQDQKKAIEYSEIAVEEGKKNGTWQCLAPAINNSGKIYFRAGLMDKAAERLVQYLELIREHGTKKEIAYALFNLGTVRLDLQDNDKAEEYLKKAVQLLNEYAKENSTSILPLDLIQVNNNLGIINKQKGDYQKAVEYFDTGVDIARKNPEHSQTLGSLLASRGEILSLFKKRSEAKKDLNEAIQIAHNSQNKMLESASLLLIGQVFEADNNESRALEYFKQGYQLAVEQGSNELLHEIANQLSTSFQKIGKPDSALRYLTISNEFAEKIKRDKAPEELTKGEVKEQYIEKEKVELVKHKSEIQKFVLLLLISVAIAGFFILMYYTYKRKHQIAEQNNTKIEANLNRLKAEKSELEKTLNIERKDSAAQAIINIQKDEVIGEVVEKLRIHTNQIPKSDNELIATIIRDLGRLNNQRSWEEFELRFTKVHPEFSAKLQTAHPNLSVNEKRICSFLHLNMTSKEISDITGQSSKTIDMARTRLRNKLGLTNQGMSLTEYLASI